MRSWTGKNAFLGLLAVVLSLPLPAVAQVVGEIPIPVGNANPRGIVLGQDSNFWFSAYGVDQIGRMTPDGTFTFFTLPPVANQTFLGPEDIVSGLDGALYFIETQPGAVKRITTAGGISSLPFQPSINTNLIGKATHIVAHSDGLLWFTIQSTQAIGRMTTAGTGAEVYGDPSSGNPSAIASGPDGAIWYTSDFGINKVTGINIQNRLSADLYRFPSNNVPVSIVAGPDGAMWAATSGNTIARVTTSGQVTEFTIPSPFMRSDHITTGADGALWFAATTSTTEKVGRMTTSGVYSEFDVGAAGSPRSFATGPDSALWLTQASGSGTDNIGRLVVAKTAQTISFTSAPPANATVGGATYTPSATATSSLAVSFAIDVTTSSVCSIAAGVVSFTRASPATPTTTRPKPSKPSPTSRARRASLSRPPLRRTRRLAGLLTCLRRSRAPGLR
jgi:virginiamycin B lyase